MTLKFLPNAKLDIMALVERVNSLGDQVRFVAGKSPSLVFNMGKLSDEEF